MALLPNKNVFDGSKTPAPTVTEMKTAWGALRDFAADLLGTDSSDKKSARVALGVPSAVDVQAGVDKFAVAAGTADAMTVTMTPPVKELVEGMEIRVRCIGPNTLTAPTIKVDELPAVTIVAADGGAVVTGAYLDKWPGTFRYRASINKFEFLNPVPVVSTGKSSVRQTVLSGATDANGYANMLAAGGGLALNLSATGTPLLLSFANGFDVGGESNLLSRLSADKSNVVTALAASNITYVYADYVSPTEVSWGKTLAPVQYGTSYNRAAQSCLSLNNISTDDFGNNWAFSNVAFSNVDPAIAGTYMAVFNGTTSKIVAPFNYLGDAGWTIRMKLKPAAIGSIMMFFTCGSNANFILSLGINAAGKLLLYASSNLSSYDIAGGVTGGTTLAVGAKYDVELSFDAVTGKYLVYLGGVPEISVNSALKVPQQPQITLGMYSNGANPYAGSIQGFEFLPYCLHPNGVAFVPPATLASVATPGYCSNFFHIADMKMYQITGPSAVADTNPVMAQKSRVYVGQATTGVATVAGVINYALRGQYNSGWFAVAISLAYTKNHFIGSALCTFSLDWNQTAIDDGARNVPQYAISGGSAGAARRIDRLTASAYAYDTYTYSSGNATALPLASQAGFYRMIILRSW